MIDNPFILSAFIIFIPLIIYYKFANKHKHSLTTELKKKLKMANFFFCLFIAFTIIALAGPRWGTGFIISEYRRGLDTVFAIDVSHSMDIKDANNSETQSRLERGLLIARDTAMAVTGARFAAAIGRSRGYLAVPLTWDSEACLTFLQTLDGSTMTGRSTNLEALLDAAADAFQSSSPARKVIVLISDGEALEGVLNNALARCVREGFIVNTVALGSDAGRPVLVSASDPQAGSVISRRNAAVMRAAAERTGGIYIDGSREDAASVLSNHLLSISMETSPGSSSPEPKERRTLFIILAIIAYGASKLIPRLSSGKILPIAWIIFFVSMFTSCSDGKLLLVEANYLHSRGRYDEAIIPYIKALNIKDSAPYAEYGLGLTFHSLDEGIAALRRFETSQKLLEDLPYGEHRELRYRLNYNSGIIFFEEGEYHLAAASFREALRTDPRKIDAKRNLELSLMSIERQTKEENQGEVSQENETREILFEFLREQEQQLWRSREWAPEEKTTGADY